MQQAFIWHIYTRFSQPSSGHHRVHATVAIIAKEWQLAENANRPPNIGRVSVKVIDKACAALSAHYLQWPDMLWSKDLSKQAAAQPLSDQWWIPDRASDDEDGGESLFV
jgi:hypothetical protein